MTLFVQFKLSLLFLLGCTLGATCWAQSTSEADALWKRIFGDSSSTASRVIEPGASRPSVTTAGSAVPRLGELDPRTIVGSRASWITPAEIAEVEKMSPDDPARLRRIKGHLGRLVINRDRDLAAGKTNSVYVRAMERYGGERFNAVRADIGMAQKATSPGMAAAQKLRTDIQTGKVNVTSTGSRLFRFLPKLGLVDLPLQGLRIIKDSQEEKALEEIQKDLANGKCPAEPSEDYAKQFVLIDIDHQNLILSKCGVGKDALKGLSPQLAKIRQISLDNFSQSEPKCEVRDGIPVIETLSSAGTQQRILFDKGGNLKSLQVFPQPDSAGRVSKFQGSFIEYFPNDTVSYTAIQPKGVNSRQGGVKSPMEAFELSSPLPDPQSKIETLNSFAGRVSCSTGIGCGQVGSTDQFAIADLSQAGGLGASVDKPFGRITPNKEFLINGAKTVSQFRIGLKENQALNQDFRSYCIKLGKKNVSEIPDLGSATPVIPAAGPKNQTTEAIQ